MKIYHLSYDLNKPEQDYKELIERLNKYQNKHIMKSTWIIKTDEDANTIFQKVKPHLDQNDTLLISEITSNRQGLLNCWDWIGNTK